MTTGNRIANLRKQNGMSQFQLAKVIGIATSTLGMYETNKRTPSPKVLEKIAHYFSVSTDYLLGLNPQKPTNPTPPAQTADLSEDDVLFTYQGKPLSDEDKELIRRLMKGKG